MTESMQNPLWISSGLKADILGRYANVLKDLKFGRNIKRCGLCPTDYILYMFCRKTSEVVRATKDSVFTWRTYKKLRNALDNVLSKTDVVTMTRAIKVALTKSYYNRLFSYSISKIKSIFDTKQAVEALTPAAIEKHKTTLSVAVDEIPQEDLLRTKEITRTLLRGVKFNFDKIPSIGVKSSLEVSCGDGGKREALKDEREWTFSASQWRGVGSSDTCPMIVVSSDYGAQSVPHCPMWRNMALTSFTDPKWDRDTVKVAVVPGPLKARVITKETAGNMFLEAVRFGVWSRLRKHEMFLIDGPIRVEDIPKRLPDEIYVSGDYTAATDGFHPEVSEAICEVIADFVCDYLNDELLNVVDCYPLSDIDEGIDNWRDQTLYEVRHLIKSTMTNKTIIYPDGSEIRQRRGQLMGNLLSFPVLCIYNYVVFHIAEERLHNLGKRGLRVKDQLPLIHRVRINGDDILFPATERRYLNWRSECDRLGMELNDLKTQLSNRYCNLNSQLFCESEGRILKVYAHRVFKDEVPINECRAQRKLELVLCGEGAPGVSLYNHELAVIPEKRERVLYIPDWLQVLEKGLVA